MSATVTTAKVARLDACVHATIIRVSAASAQAHMQAGDRPIWAARCDPLARRELGGRPGTVLRRFSHAND